MLKFAICDDSESLRSKFIGMTEKVIEKNNIQAEIVYDTGDPEEFFDYVSKNCVDVVFLDVDLRSVLTGLDLAQKIRDINKSVNIIFVTAHMEYVLLAFKVKTFDYLIKPVSQAKLEECIVRLAQFTCTDTADMIKIKSGPSTYLVKKNDIVYIEKVGSKSFVYTVNEIIETYSTLEDFERILPDNFHRSHKSYVVNVHKISKVDAIKNEVIFNNSYKCYIGRKYRKSILEYFGKKD